MKQKILFLFLFLFAAQIAIPAVVFADTGELYFKPEVLIPGMDPDGSGGAATTTIDGKGEAIRLYVSNFYKFAIGLTGILATIMFAVGGLIWLTSGGSATQVGKAKQCILGSLTGLILALGSYVILNTINPNIVNLHFGSEITALGNIGVGCQWVKRDGGCNPVYEQEDKYGADSPKSCGAKPKDSAGYYCCCTSNVPVDKICDATVKFDGERIKCGDKWNDCIGNNCYIALYTSSLCQLYKNDDNKYTGGQCLSSNIKIFDKNGTSINLTGSIDIYDACGDVELKTTLTSGSYLLIGTRCGSEKTCTLIGDKLLINKEFEEGGIDWLTSIQTWVMGADAENLFCM